MRRRRCQVNFQPPEQRPSARAKIAWVVKESSDTPLPSPHPVLFDPNTARDSIRFVTIRNARPCRSDRSESKSVAEPSFRFPGE